MIIPIALIVMAIDIVVYRSPVIALWDSGWIAIIGTTTVLGLEKYGA